MARIGLSLSVALLLLISGCSFSTAPSFSLSEVEKNLENICKKEYKVNIKAKLVGQTLWIYLPLDDVAEMETKEKNAANKEKHFEIRENSVLFNKGAFKAAYEITRVSKEEPPGGGRYRKDAAEKINYVWRALRRMLFSMERSREREPNFFSLVVADIMKGFETQQIFYHLDLRKVSYGYISWDEYYHRIITDTNFSPEIIGDMEGSHLKRYNVKIQDFIAMQIQSRIRLKFEKPEVDKNVDIDKEVLKTITSTMKIYGFADFSAVELETPAKGKMIYNRPAILANSP